MEKTELTDQELIAEYLKRDEHSEHAFRLLVERHTPAAYHFIHRLAGNTHDTEDIIQETFVKVWRYLKRYRPEQSFKVWLFTIARNTTIDLQRKRKSVVISDFENDEGDNVLLDTLADKEPLAHETFSQNESAAELRKDIEKLPTIYQEILTLRYGDDLSFEEISAIIKKPLNTAKSRHRRALIALRKVKDTS